MNESEECGEKARFVKMHHVAQLLFTGVERVVPMELRHILCFELAI